MIAQRSKMDINSKQEFLFYSMFQTFVWGLNVNIFRSPVSQLASSFLCWAIRSKLCFWVICRGDLDCILCPWSLHKPATDVSLSFMCRLELRKLFTTKSEVMQKPLVLCSLNVEINAEEVYLEFDSPANFWVKIQNFLSRLKGLLLIF